MSQNYWPLLLSSITSVLSVVLWWISIWDTIFKPLCAIAATWALTSTALAYRQPRIPIIDFSYSIFAPIPKYNALINDTLTTIIIYAIFPIITITSMWLIHGLSALLTVNIILTYSICVILGVNANFISTRWIGGAIAMEVVLNLGFALIVPFIGHAARPYKYSYIEHCHTFYQNHELKICIALFAINTMLMTVTALSFRKTLYSRPFRTDHALKRLRRNLLANTP